MLDKLEERNKILEKTIQLANTSDEDLEKMSFREKQKVFKAKTSLCKKVWDSSKGTYKKKVYKAKVKKADKVGVNVK